MPNWCENQTEIIFKSEVKQEEIKEFIDDLVINKDNEKVLNLMKLVPLQRWGSKWAPAIDGMTYDEEHRVLSLDYLSAWSPINEAFISIYESHDDLIESISSRYKEPSTSYYGDFYVDKYVVDENTYDLPNINIEENNFKRLYKIIKDEKADVKLPNQLMDDIKNSDNYIDFLKNISSTDEFDKYDYDFDELWDDYIYQSDLANELEEHLKEYNQDFDDYVTNIIDIHTPKKKK